MSDLGTIVIFIKSYQAAVISVLVLTIIWLINMAKILTSIKEERTILKDEATQTKRQDKGKTD